MDIDTMPAGPELDALVAEKVMELPNAKLGDACPRCRGETRIGINRAWCYNCGEWIYSPYPEYSTDISDAWQVIEKLTKSLDEIFADDEEKYGYWTLDRLGFDCCKDGKPDIDGAHGQYRCWFSKNLNADNRQEVFATADTAPLAICHAALKAVMNR